MNKEEFAKIAAYLRTAYPNSNFMNTPEVINTWYLELSDLDYEVCQKAMRGYVRNNEYPPSIAAIIKSCSKETKILVRPYNEAWEDVLMLVRKYGSYGAKKAVEQMDPLTKKVVRSIGFSNICSTSSITSVKKEFRELYDTYKSDMDYETNTNSNKIGISCKEA